MGGLTGCYGLNVCGATPLTHMLMVLVVGSLNGD